MLSIGGLIWVSVRPLLRLVICTSCGFIITKQDIFPLVAARGVGQILLNIALPALMLSRIVPAFTSQNIGALGPLVLVAVLYEVLGIFIAWLVKQFFWVPHRFRYSVLVAGGWSNVGDVPTAVIMSITGSSPFNGSTDQTVAVAYISAFILVFFITLFPMGGCNLIEWDYRGPDVDDEEVRKSMPIKTRESLQQLAKSMRSLRKRKVGRRSQIVDADENGAEEKKEDCGRTSEGDIEKGCSRDGKFASGTDCVDEKECDPDPESNDVAEVDCSPSLVQISRTSSFHQPQPQKCQKHVSFHTSIDMDDASTAVPTDHYASRMCSPAHTINEGSPSRITSPTPSVTRVDSESAFTPSRAPSRHVQFRSAPNVKDTITRNNVPKSVGPSTTTHPRSHALHHRILAYARTVFLSMFTVQTITISLALLIALVPTLKALFTPIENSHIPNAPDGQPPLAFILDTASFIGAASVPMGLICLGSALARLQVPRSQWNTLPLGAISALAIGKMILMPVVGVLIVQGLTNAGLINKDDAVLRFVCIFLSCIPTATTQVYLTQVYSGTGDASTLSAFLIPQYALMFITMTVLSAYTLSILF